MTTRDDMVFRPSLGSAAEAAARRTRRDRAIRATTDKKSAGLRRALQAREARRFARRTTSSSALGDLGKLGRVTAAAAGAIAALAAVRMGTDTPFEGMGLWVNKQIMGEGDERARAFANVRGSLSSNPVVAMIVGQDGISPQLRMISDALIKLETQREIGRTKIFEAFPVDGTADNLILSVERMFKRAWDGLGGDESLTVLRNQLRTRLRGMNGSTRSYR